MEKFAKALSYTDTHKNTYVLLCLNKFVKIKKNVSVSQGLKNSGHVLADGMSVY